MTNKIKKIQFKCNNFVFIQTNLKRIFTRGTKEETLFLWTKIQTLTDRDLRHKINKKYAKILFTKFGLSYLPVPILTIEYTPFWGNRIFKKLCSSITKRIFKTNIAILLNKALKIIPTKPKSIMQILSNTMKKTHQRSFQCAGHPWCTAESHFTKDLKELGGLYSKVGAKNANTVPWKQEGEGTILTMIGEWLRRLLIYKFGLNGNITKRLNLQILTDKNRINIYTDNGEVFSLPKLTIWNLWKDFCIEGHEKNVAEFVKKLNTEYQQLKPHEKINKLKLEKNLETKISEVCIIKEQRHITYFDKIKLKHDTKGRQEIIMVNLTEEGHEKRKLEEIQKILKESQQRPEHFLLMITSITEDIKKRLASSYKIREWDMCYAPFVTGAMWEKRTAISSNIHLYLIANKLTTNIKKHYRAIFQNQTIKNSITKKCKKMAGYWGHIAISGNDRKQREKLVVEIYENFAQLKPDYRYSMFSRINIDNKLPLH